MMNIRPLAITTIPVLISFAVLCITCCENENRKTEEKKDLQYYLDKIGRYDLSGDIDSAIYFSDVALGRIEGDSGQGMVKVLKSSLYLRKGNHNRQERALGITLLWEALSHFKNIRDKMHFTGSISMLQRYSSQLGLLDTALIEEVKDGIRDSLFYEEWNGYFYLSMIQYDMGWPRDSVITNIEKAIELTGEGHPTLLVFRDKYISHYDSLESEGKK